MLKARMLQARLAVSCALAVGVGCGDSGTTGGTASTGSGGASSSTGAIASTGSMSTSSTSSTSSTGGSGPLDLCAGLVSDKDAHPMTSIPKPAVGTPITDAEFGTTIRRITQVGNGGGNPAIVPMYTTISAWNADESLLLLYSVADGEHQLFDGKTYAFQKVLPIAPADVEQVWWHTTDPDILYYTDDRDFIRYHVSSGAKDVLMTFSSCSGSVTNGDDPMFTSWDSGRIGLGCDTSVFIYDIAANQVLGSKLLGQNPAQIAPSGTLGYLSDTGGVTDTDLNVLRTLDLLEPYGHADLSRLPNGHDTWNGAVYDPGPNGNDDIGSLVTFDLTDGSSHVVIGPKTGWPYPPTTHLSGKAIRQPGWIFVSTLGDTSGQGLLDMEMLVADTSTNAVCRIGRHRSWGKDDTQLSDSYWAEAHTVPSPSGTRAVFASDWENSGTVDTYVVELPSYGK